MPSKPKKISIRLNAQEAEMLNGLCNGQTSYTPSELFRFFLHREHNRRHARTSVVPNAAYSTDWRIGKPKGKRGEAA